MRSANSTGPSMLAGSLTRSRARNTPSATALRAAKALAGGVRLGALDREPAQPVARLLLGAVLGLAGGAILLEGVAAQQRAERQIGGEHLRARLAGIGRLGDEAGRLTLAGADLGQRVAAEQQPVQLLGGPPGADQQQPRGVDAGRRQDLDRRLGLAGEVGGAGGLRQRALHALVEAARGRRQRQLLDQPAARRVPTGAADSGSELDFEEVRTSSEVPALGCARLLLPRSHLVSRGRRREASAAVWGVGNNSRSPTKRKQARVDAMLAKSPSPSSLGHPGPCARDPSLSWL